MSNARDSQLHAHFAKKSQLLNLGLYETVTCCCPQYGDVTANFSPHIEDINGTLHINGVTMQDKGQYVCTATNSFTSINVTIDVDVVSEYLQYIVI